MAATYDILIGVLFFAGWLILLISMNKLQKLYASMYNLSSPTGTGAMKHRMAKPHILGDIIFKVIFSPEKLPEEYQGRARVIRFLLIPGIIMFFSLVALLIFVGLPSFIG